MKLNFQVMKCAAAILLGILLFSHGCNQPASEASVEKWKQEIVETEKEFAGMAAERGIKKAFLHYAAEDAVLMRNNMLVTGKAEMADIFEGQGPPTDDELLAWEPEFVDVALSGELGYTYGYYTYSYTDSTGNRIESEGVFHTVWKRQPDGTWRFVWD